MTESTAPARPSQVTLAGWLVVGGSVVVVLMAFSRVAGLGSLDTQEAIQDFLDGSLGTSLDLTVSGVQTILRITSMVAAATAATCAVLGWQVLQRSRGARVALSALALPLFVTGFVGGGFASAVVTAAIVMLWFQPARDWFDGVTRPAPAPVAAPSAHLRDLPPPTGSPIVPAHQPLHPSVHLAATRPSSVVWACTATWVATVMAFMAGLTTLAQFLADPDRFISDVRRDYPDVAVSDADLRTTFVVVCVVILVWSVIAAAFALLVWRRSSWAAVALTVSAVLACLTLVPVIACVATVVLLQRSESRLWLRR